MSDFISGVVGICAGIWLKDYLDKKGRAATTMKQKSIECYRVVTELITVLGPKQVLCAELIKCKDINKHIRLAERYSDDPLAAVDKLQLLVIENFYLLKPDMLKIASLIGDQLAYYQNIIINYQDSHDEKDFDQKTKQYNFDIQDLCRKFRLKLDDLYINPKNRPCNFFYYLVELKKFSRDFFKKYP